MTIREFHNRLKALDIQYLKEEAVFRNRDELVRLNQSQLHLGETKTGDNISPSYRDRDYAEYKTMLSSYEAPNFVPDLFVTGEFYKGMDVEVSNNEYDIYSRDEKNDDLTLKYKDIFGLQDKNKEIAMQIVTKTFVNLISEKLKN